MTEVVRSFPPCKNWNARRTAASGRSCKGDLPLRAPSGVAANQNSYQKVFIRYRTPFASLRQRLWQKTASGSTGLTQFGALTSLILTTAPCFPLSFLLALIEIVDRGCVELVFWSEKQCSGSSFAALGTWRTHLHFGPIEDRLIEVCRSDC
jgi:hypothetical protein